MEEEQNNLSISKLKDEAISKLKDEAMEDEESISKLKDEAMEEEECKRALSLNRSLLFIEECISKLKDEEAMEEEESAISNLKDEEDEAMEDEEYDVLDVSKVNEDWAEIFELYRVGFKQEEPDDPFWELSDDEFPDLERVHEEQTRRALKVQDSRRRTMTRIGNSENLKNLARDVRHYKYIYVFSFCNANLDSPLYWRLIRTLRKEDIKVYFGPDPTSLAKKLAKIRRRGLREIADSLHSQEDVGLLLTHKTEEEVFSKFKEYFELEYLEPLELSWSTLVFEEGEVLSLPTESSATSILPELQQLGMPVELSEDGVLKLTKRKAVCVEGRSVTENNAKILRLLERKMHPSFISLICHWSASTGAISYNNFPTDASNGNLPGGSDFKWG